MLGITFMEVAREEHKGLGWSGKYGLFLAPVLVAACGTEHPRLLCPALYVLPQLNTVQEKTVGILRENTAAAFGSL